MIRAARVTATTARGLFIDDALHVRAAALTYFTVLSLVPLLAFAFAVLKGFGAYDTLVEQTIRPYLHINLAANPALQRAVEQLLGFVANTGVASLGTLGLLALLYAATRLLRNIEIALNDIWGARTARNALQQLRDYVAIIVVTPICMMAAFALTTLGQLVEMIRMVETRLGVGGLLDWVLGALGPFAVIFCGLAFLYVVMPNTRVKPRSAAIGALIGAFLWYVVLVMHVRFQVGVARFNALYSGFAAVPIFLAWLHLSWLVVLVGAQTAAAEQNSPAHALRGRLARADQTFKETLCVSAMLHITEAFVAGRRLPSLVELSGGDELTRALLLGLLSEPVRAGLLLMTGPENAPSYALARSPERIRLADVIDSVRRAEPDERGRVKHWPGVHPSAERAYLEFERARDALPENRTLADLVGTHEQSSGILRRDAPDGVERSSEPGPEPRGRVA
jgi:membrane protein